MSRVAPTTKPRQRRKRVNDPKHMAFVASLPCCLTGRQGEGVQVHHLLRVPTNERGASKKSGDDWVIPLWHETHSLLHTCGWDERKFLRSHGVWGIGLAALLYRLSGDEDACLRAIEEMRR